MMYKRQPSALSHGVHERRGNVSANTSHVGVMEMSSNEAKLSNLAHFFSSTLQLSLDHACSVLHYASLTPLTTSFRYFIYLN